MATEQEIKEFVKDVAPNHIAVIVEKDDGSLARYSDDCRSDYCSGTGRVVNSRCVGANAYSSNVRIFTVWRRVADGELQVAEYLGKFLFPEPEELEY